MDLGGPLYLKDNSKVWFVVFTCMSVRAIHLELVTSLSVEALTQALQRFMDRRGVPQLCISDHGSNFVAAAKWVKEKNLDMKWQFVVERGPWWGGAWERLVGNAFQTKMWHSNLKQFRRVLVFDAEKVCVSERFWLIGRRKRSVQLSPPGTIHPISPKCTI